MSAEGDLRRLDLTAARQKALRVLGKRHPEELADLYAAELEAAGIGLPSTEKACPCGNGTLRRLLGQPWPRTCDQCGKGSG